MSGAAVSRALTDSFDAIRRSELDRLEKKLRSLADHERRHVEAITAEIVHAIAVMPAQACAGEVPAPDVEALVRLFNLEIGG